MASKMGILSKWKSPDAHVRLQILMTATPNHAMRLTQHFVAITENTRTLNFKVLGGSAYSR